jgi:hypothetical protein
MQRNTLLALSSILLMGILTACSSASASPQTAVTPASVSTAAATTSVVAQGWVSYGKPADGFSLALPAGFKSYTADPKDIDKSIAELKNSEPQAATALSLFKTRSPLPTLFAFDAAQEARTSGYLNTVDVMKDMRPYGISLDPYVQSILGTFDKVDAIVKPVKHERIKTSNGEFEKFQYEVRGTNQIVGVVTQLVGVNGSVAYILTLTTNTHQMEKYDPIYDQIIQTFQLK